MDDFELWWHRVDRNVPAIAKETARLAWKEQEKHYVALRSAAIYLRDAILDEIQPESASVVGICVNDLTSMLRGRYDR